MPSAAIVALHRGHRSSPPSKTSSIAQAKAPPAACVERQAERNTSVHSQRKRANVGAPPWAEHFGLLSHDNQLLVQRVAISISAPDGPSSGAKRAMQPHAGHLTSARPNQRRNRRLGSRQNTRWRCIAERANGVMSTSISPLLAHSCGWSPRDEPGSRSTRKCNDAHPIKRHLKVFLKVVLNAPHRYPFPKIVPHRK